MCSSNTHGISLKEKSLFLEKRKRNYPGHNKYMAWMNVVSLFHDGSQVGWMKNQFHTCITYIQVSSISIIEREREREGE